MDRVGSGVLGAAAGVQVGGKVGVGPGVCVEVGENLGVSVGMGVFVDRGVQVGAGVQVGGIVRVFVGIESKPTLVGSGRGPKGDSEGKIKTSP